MTDIDFDPVYDSDDDSYITEPYPGRTTTTRAATTTARRSSTRSAPAPVYTSDDDDTTDVELDPVYGSDDDSNATDFEPGPYITETKSRPTRTAVTSYVTTYVTSTVAGSVASSFSLPPNCFCTEPARRPVYSSATSSVTSSAPAKASGSAAWKGNPYSGVDIWLNTDYASSIRNRAIPRLAGAMATAAEKVAKTPAFYWMDSLSKTPVMKKMLADIREANRKGGNYAGQFVVYDLPDRDCAAAASSGEFTIRNNGVAKYKNYIDTIRKIVLAYSDVRIMLIIEPDSLSNMVTNLNIAKCSKAKSAYLEGVNYALRQLNLPNVAMYLDAGHAGWLGWPANQDSAAQLFAKVYKDAGSPSSLRGLVTNVANYNGWDTATPPRYTTGNAIYDEKHYIHALSPLLERHGWAGARFITDQGRAGRQPTGQTSWSHWCNAKGTGFGLRPSANTGDALLDAFVWVKPGGESDGTSKASSRRYDYHCGFEDALKPAPEAGEWFHEHFVQLLRNANPPFL
ncbi:Exoglucanase 2 [Claviceps purpurea]|nr:Exoglucanase 2 [Claviceps purpurea]